MDSMKVCEVPEQMDKCQLLQENCKVCNSSSTAKHFLNCLREIIKEVTSEVQVGSYVGFVNRFLAIFG
jgi:hypothetical protein